MRTLIIFTVATAGLLAANISCTNESKAQSGPLEFTIWTDKSTYALNDTIWLNWKYTNISQDSIKVYKYFCVPFKKDTANIMVSGPQGEVTFIADEIYLDPLPYSSFVSLAPDSTWQSNSDSMPLNYEMGHNSWDFSVTGNYTIYGNYNTEYLNILWSGDFEDADCWIGSINSNTISITIEE